VPALAALAACLIQHAITHGRMRVIRAGAVMSAALMAIVGGGLFWLLGSQAQIHQIAGANLLGVVLCGGAVVVVGLGLASRPVVALTAIAATLVVANYVFALVSLPAVEAFKPVLPMVQTIEARAAGRSEGEPIPPVAHYREVLPSMAFYLKRPIEDIFDMQTLVARVHQVPAMYIMMRPNHYAELQARAFPLDIPTCIISRHTLFEAKLKNVLSGEAWPQLLLVGTRAACAR